MAAAPCSQQGSRPRAASSPHVVALGDATVKVPTGRPEAARRQRGCRAASLGRLATHHGLARGVHPGYRTLGRVEGSDPAPEVFTRRLASRYVGVGGGGSQVSTTARRASGDSTPQEISLIHISE